MGIDNSLFGKIQSPIVSPALAAGVDKANENKAREDSMKEIMSRKPTASTDQAQLAATVAPQKKAPQKSESSKPTASPSQPKTRSWQDKMGSTAAEMGKEFYGVDAKEYSSKADYDKAVEDAIVKRDAGLKGSATTSTNAVGGKPVVVEGENAGKVADMSNNETQAAQTTASPSSASPQTQANNPYAGFTPPPGVYVKEMRTNPNTGIQYPVWSEPGEAAPATQIPQGNVPATANSASRVLVTPQSPQGAPILSQGVENGRAFTLVNEPNGNNAYTQPITSQTLPPEPLATPMGQPSGVQGAQLPQGVLKEGINEQGQPYVVVTPEYARLHGLGAQQPNGVGPQDPGNYPGRYVGGAAPAEAGWESLLSKWGLPIGAALLGGVLGYQFGKNSNDNNDSRYYDNSYDRGYGFNDY